MFYVPLKPLKVLMTQDDRHGRPGGTLSKAGCGPAPPMSSLPLNQCSGKFRDYTDQAETGLKEQCDVRQVVCDMGLARWGTGTGHRRPPYKGLPKWELGWGNAARPASQA
ncbi:hypothetical protein PAL_GLEAN10024723 [Pteropus alecto]|uniref:Uncharacterized protein n=1 Tax=Pteropus alecto TaxID=9402 RepID=L5K0Z8_PTEAL|nr:hypothetical protein PAL_GLEAN10024723 [Pteropus alecto]